MKELCKLKNEKMKELKSQIPTYSLSYFLHFLIP